MKRKIILLILIVLSVTLGAGFVITQNMAASPTPRLIRPVSPTPLPVRSKVMSWGPNTIADIAEKVGPAVVNVDVVKNVRVRSPFSSFDRDFGFELMPEFKNFFRDRVVPQKGAGSGFIIDKKGHILTNEHVVRGADKIKVSLKDGRKLNAKVIGKDASLDLAIIKVDAKNIPTIKMGDSSKIRPGEWTIAIGNPYGFANSVSAGIISATGRTIRDLGKKNLIQTDTPINPGNSGGPLLNLEGEVIGINTAIVAGAQSIGFSIPINAAKDVIDDLIKKGKITRPWLGVYMRDVDEKIANYLDLPIAEGIIILDVVKDSPADKMGMKKYDIIKSINEKKMKSSSEISEIVSKMKPKDKITLKVYRDGKNKILKGRLHERP